VLSKSPIAAPDVDEELLRASAGSLLEGRLALGPPQRSDPIGALGCRGERGAGDSTLAGPRAPVDRITAAARMAAAIMRSDGGPEVAVLEATGWILTPIRAARRVCSLNAWRGLDAALRRARDRSRSSLGPNRRAGHDRIRRTAAMNGTRGTDHGTAVAPLTWSAAPFSGGRVIAMCPGAWRRIRPRRAAISAARLDLRSVFKGVL